MIPLVGRVAAAPRMAAQTLRNSRAERDSQPQAAREAGERRGAARSNLARILYAVITRRMPYHKDEAFKQTPATQTRRLINLQKQAAKLGLQLIPAAT